MDNNRAKLYAKIAAISASMTRIRKTGTMQGQGNYKFATDTDIVEAVREEMAKVNLACIPSIVSYQQMQETTKNGSTTMRTICEFTFVLACGDTGETIESHWFNEALDSSDKGFNKTATAAMKYFFMKTFQITTGEPDIHESERVEIGNRRAPSQPSQQQQQPPPANVNPATGEIDDYAEFVCNKLVVKLAQRGRNQGKPFYIYPNAQQPNQYATDFSRDRLRQAGYNVDAWDKVGEYPLNPPALITARMDGDYLNVTEIAQDTPL